MTRFALMITEREVRSEPLTLPLESLDRQNPLTPTANLLPLIVSKIIFSASKPSMN